MKVIEFTDNLIDAVFDIQQKHISLCSINIRTKKQIHIWRVKTKY